MHASDYPRKLWAAISRHPVYALLFTVLGSVAAYDTFSGQVAQLTDLQLPSLHTLAGRYFEVGAHLLPWWGWVILLLVTLNVALLWQLRPGAEPAASAPSPLVSGGGGEAASKALNAQRAWGPNSQASLVESMRRVRGDDPNEFTMEISYASSAQRLLADRLVAIFEAAGWNTNFNNVPLEHYRPHILVQGIEVRGYNDYYTRAVADALQGAGLESVRTTVAPNQIKPTNPKYPEVVRHLYIALGHNNASIPAGANSAENPALLDALRVLILSRFGLVMDRYLGVVFTMLQACKSRDMALTCEDLLDQGIRHRFYNLRLEAERDGVDPEGLASHLGEVFKLYADARFYIQRFQRLCAVDPMQEQIKLWLEADRECLVALRDLRARGLSKAVEKIEDGVMASTRTSDWLN